MWASPPPDSTVWRVLGSWRMVRLGSSVDSLRRVVASLSSWAGAAALMATPYTGAGGGVVGTVSESSSDRVSPVRVSSSLVTAAMSPAAASSTGVWDDPVSDTRWWRRSLSPVRALISVSLDRRVPDTTLR